MATAPTPRATVRMYRQGLGDCLYVELLRGKNEPFRIMIDCGLVLGAAKQQDKMKAVMADIVKTLKGKPLDLLVVTHPHWDHVSGFVQAEEEFSKIAVKAVWLAWTEDDRDPLARKLRTVHAAAETALRASIDPLRKAGLDVVAQQTASLLDFLGATKQSGRTTRDAVKAAAAKVSVPHYCLPGEDPFPIPGSQARIFVLGPPRDEKSLSKMNPSTRDPETYSLSALGGLAGLADAFGDVQASKPFDANFTIPLDDAKALTFFSENYAARDPWRRIDNDWLQATSGFALLLDRAVNNSSLALAIELEPGGDVLLFAADAQVGNWLSWLTLSWTLDGGTVTGSDLIARSIVYKVGHHASLNASLREQGVETMNRLQFALVPVDAQEAIARKWGNNIPFPALLAALGNKAKGGVLRSDEDGGEKHPAVTALRLAYEVSV